MTAIAVSIAFAALVAALGYALPKVLQLVINRDLIVRQLDEDSERVDRITSQLTEKPKKRPPDGQYL